MSDDIEEIAKTVEQYLNETVYDDDDSDYSNSSNNPYFND